MFVRFHFFGGTMFARHHDKWARLERFALWCAACPQDQLVVVSHQHVCRMLLGVVLDNCDVVGMTLDRESCRWAPLAYEDWRKVTLQSTCAKGSREGLRALLAAKDRGRMINEDVGGGVRSLCSGLVMPHRGQRCPDCTLFATRHLGESQNQCHHPSARHNIAHRTAVIEV